MSPLAPITDPGVTVATGDPDQISAAGNWHSSLAAKLEAHSALIKSTASHLLSGWNGDASKQYQALSAEMSGHYTITAAQARVAASALKKFASELGTAQGDGRVALQQAIHWMNQVNSWEDKLGSANAATTGARAKVQADMQAVIAAHHAASAPGAPPTAAKDVADAQTNLQAARNALASAQNDQANATKQLKNASDHFTMWQKKGGTALQDAEKAAGVVGLALGAVAISSPQVAGAINDFVNGWTATASSSAFAGYQASGGGGPSWINWQGLFQAGAGATATATGTAGLAGVSGDASAQAFAGEQGTLDGSLGWSQLGATGDVNELGGAEATADANGQFGLSGIGANGGVSAFVGGQANASGTADLGPAQATGNVGVSAGLGFQAGGSIDVTAGKVGVSWNLGATLGLGADFSGSVSLDPQKALSDLNRALPWNW